MGYNSGVGLYLGWAYTQGELILRGVLILRGRLMLVVCLYHKFTGVLILRGGLISEVGLLLAYVYITRQ